MEIQIIEKRDATFYQVIGKICTLKDYDDLKNIVTAITTKSTLIVIDLSKVTFTSSQGLGVLVFISEEIRDSGTNVVFFNPRQEIKATMELAGIHRVVTIVYSEEEIQKFITHRK